MTSLMLTLVVLVLVVVATVLQRLTGLGFAMLVTPFFVIMLGTHSGVMLTALLAIVASVVMLPSMWRHVDWSAVAWIGLPAVLIVPVASWVGRWFDTAIIYLLVGGLVLVGLSTSLALQRTSVTVTGRFPRVLTGSIAGAGTVLAGIGGPAMTIYGVLSRWPMLSFAASMQPLWIVICVAAVFSRWLILGSTPPEFPWWGWLGCVLGIVIGARVGQRLRRVVDDRWAFRIVVVIAMVGAVLSAATGVVALLDR